MRLPCCVHRLRHLPMLAHFPRPAQLAAERFQPAGDVRSEAAGHDQADAAGRALAEIRGELREVARPCLPARCASSPSARGWAACRSPGRAGRTGADRGSAGGQASFTNTLAYGRRTMPGKPASGKRRRGARCLMPAPPAALAHTNDAKTVVDERKPATMTENRGARARTSGARRIGTSGDHEQEPVAHEQNQWRRAKTGGARANRGP